MNNFELLGNELRDRLVTRGRELFREEMAAGFSRIKSLNSDTSREALAALVSAAPAALVEWSHSLPEAGVLLSYVKGDRASVILRAAPRRDYLDACSIARQAINQARLAAAENARIPSRSELSQLRLEIQRRGEGLGVKFERMDPMTNVAESKYGPFAVRTFYSWRGNALSYGHTVLLNQTDVFINFHFMAWLGLTTTEWRLASGFDPERVATDVTHMIALFLDTISKPHKPTNAR